MNEAIDFSDIPELGDEFFSRATKRGPRVQKGSVVIDRDVYEWFEANIPASSDLISKILRAYMQEQQAKSAAGSEGQGIG
ncbi:MULTISPECIES: hypothetical protein [unclassified Duganella]|jgi:uncharacterized protein (DUF4415 family)|uniref:hypothetical protein n=1 Tax=unclassified Duganella TaxID=2636909 RepID=UPI00088D99E6|nr:MULTISPECIES: hypothetical protein [unclassified Duganella]SDG72189.1 hypothetical protein SAMN05216320_106304 [Duganella sp. OV458]SDJ98182.1 hypothetical protein SAMN05428973_107305 [Duganella sp. OV510]